MIHYVCATHNVILASILTCTYVQCNVSYDCKELLCTEKEIKAFYFIKSFLKINLWPQCALSV